MVNDGCMQDDSLCEGLTFKQDKVLVVCLSPTFQYTVEFDDVVENEVNRSSSHSLVASGKGINVSKVLKSFGQESLVLSHLGGPRVKEFMSLCENDGLNVKFAPSNSPIRTATTLVNKKKGTSTELLEQSEAVDETVKNSILELFEKECEGAKLVIISGSHPEGFSDFIYADMVRISKKNGARVILDIRGKDLLNALEFEPQIIKPNLVEFVQTFMPEYKIYENDENLFLYEAVKAKCIELYQKYKTKCIITRGGFDTWVYDGEHFSILPTQNVKVVNTIGCGDTFTATLALSLLKGSSLLEACSFSMTMATRRATRLNLI